MATIELKLRVNNPKCDYCSDDMSTWLKEPAIVRYEEIIRKHGSENKKVSRETEDAESFLNGGTFFQN